MGNRSPARFLAPIALVAAFAGVVVVTRASRSGDPTPARATTPAGTQRSRGKPKPRFAVVRPGDSLSAIAERTGMSVATLQSLNPDVDPQALHAGERLKLSK